MDQRDRLYIQREWIQWADWVRQGQTFPNVLGYKSGTVEYALMRGETGSKYPGASKVPERFTSSRNEEKLNKLFWSLPEQKKQTITGIFIHRMREQQVADTIGVTRHRVRSWLSESYIAGFVALSDKCESISTGISAKQKMV